MVDLKVCKIVRLVYLDYLTLKGDQRAYEAVVDRLEGKPKQTTDINADVRGNVQIIIEPDAGCEPIKD